MAYGCVWMEDDGSWLSRSAERGANRGGGIGPTFRALRLLNNHQKNASKDVHASARGYLDKGGRSLDT